MRIAFDVTEDDLVAAADAQHRLDPWLSTARRGMRSISYVTFLLGAALMGCAAFDYAVGNNASDGAAAPAAGFVGFVLALFGIKFWPTFGRTRENVRAQITNMLKHSTGRMLLSTRTVELAADGFRVSTPFSEAFVRWSAVLFLEADDDGLYLGLPGPSVHMVPRQAFETDSRFEAFAEAARVMWRANGGGSSDE